MAGQGPAPKEHRQRPRDEKAAGPWDVLPAEGFQGDYPRLPATWRKESVRWDRDEETREKFPVEVVEEIEFLAHTGEWYEDLARSPVACRFTVTDWRRLRDLAPLKDQYYRGAHGLAGEIRLQESLLGVTVMDRQRMRMRVAAAPAARAAAPAPVANLTKERQARLRSVPKPPE